MLKKALSIIVCIAICMMLIPLTTPTALAAEATASDIPTEGDAWDGTTKQPTTIVEKDGIKYYEITKSEELAFVAQTGAEWLSRNYILENNLILNEIVFQWNSDGVLNSMPSTLLKWVPIGDNNTRFTGVFNGNGFTISGLYINGNSRQVGLFGYIDSMGTIKNVNLVNSCIIGESDVGGIAGRIAPNGGDVINCSFNGIVKASNQNAGGIVGYTCHSIINCSSRGFIGGTGCVGGIVGYYARSNYYSAGITNCTNNSTIVGTEWVGGISGSINSSTINKCGNYGQVFGNTSIGGIAGYCSSTEISECFNIGEVWGKDSAIGGIVGYWFSETYYLFEITDVYNTATISGNTNVGGIVGKGECARTYYCYNIGNVIQNAQNETSYANLGSIIGSDGAVWETDTIKNCYYLKTQTINTNLYGCGNVSSDSNEPTGFYSKTPEQLFNQSTYINWDFSDIWSISADLNGGYPYLQWQEGSLTDITVTGVQIKEANFSLAKGDYEYLTATVSPANASDKFIIWSSSDSEIASVSSAGKVVAVAAGTAIITATTVDGGYTATCTVTVTERLAEEFRINNITIRDNDGTALSAIPAGRCLATISITNVASEGNTLVFLAAYTAEGQYQGMMWVSIEDLPVGATSKITLPVENSDGKIANLKAFSIASFTDITPLGEAVSFLTQ